MAMAPLVAIGGPEAAFFVLPLFGALLVYATYAVGSRFGSHVGLASSVVSAASPIFLYQLIQPMSDVPAAALWMTAVAAATGTTRHSGLRSGVPVGAAIVVRPNLLPLGIVIGIFLLLRPERTLRRRIGVAAVYAACCAVACVIVALTQQAFYGSPLASGYGSLAVLFSVDHVLPNLRRYLGWLWTTHTPAVVLAAAAPWLLPGALTALCVALFAVNLALYAPYVIFDDWSYLRFLLPTLPLLLVLAIAVIDAIARRAGVRGVWPVTAAALILAALFVGEARERSTFRLQALESRFARAGRFVAARLPEQALVMTSWESGSVRFYGGRKTLVWDGLAPASLDRALEFVQSRGYEPYLLFESREEQDFRRRFAGSPIAALDWPPMAEVASQVRIYRPGDRARYFQGSAPPTEYVP
jgi:hypothetical protein